MQKPKYNVSKELLEDLYLKQKLSTIQIAEKIGIKNHSTVIKKLLQYGIPKRTMSEAKMKYQKLPFSGDLKEKAYLMGLRTGDLSAHTNWFQIRIDTSSTHLAQVKMLENVFGKYTHVHNYIHKDKRGIKEYHVYCDLHKSFEFVLKKIKKIPNWILNNDNIFYYFLAGYSDAETNWNISKHGKNSIQIEFNLRTNDKKILQQIHSKLLSEEFNSKFRLFVKKGTKATYGIYTKNLDSIRIIKRKDVIKIAKILFPLSKHKEKIDKMNLIKTINKDTKWNDLEGEVLNIRKGIKDSRLQ